MGDRISIAAVKENVARQEFEAVDDATVLALVEAVEALGRIARHEIPHRPYGEPFHIKTVDLEGEAQYVARVLPYEYAREAIARFDFGEPA